MKICLLSSDLSSRTGEDATDVQRRGRQFVSVVVTFSCRSSAK